MLPGTYGVSILRNHYMNGYLDALSDAGILSQAIDGFMKSFDAKIYLFGTEIPLGAMYGILMGACALLLVAYIAIVIIKNNRK